MPIPPLKRRVYGYVARNNENQTVERKKPHNKAKNNKKRRGDESLWLTIVGTIAVIPFKILWWLLKNLWSLWQYRPRLSKAGKRAFLRTLAWSALSLIIFGFLGLAIVTAWVSRDLPDPDRLTDRQVAQSTKIYDRSGEHLLYEVFSSQKRTLVELNDIPQNLINAVVATEDSKFFTHKGVRPFSIIRSFIYGAIGRGKVGGGASTITQQLVKNVILTNEKTVTRKLKEILLSIRLEQKYSKEQILKIYFNEIPYGSTNYGIEAAAQSYFGKHVTDLTLSESATLAGLPQAPSHYLNNPSALKQRRNFVLERMFGEKYISREQATAAQTSPLRLTQRFDHIAAPHFVFYVKDLLEREFGVQAVDTGGLKVITSLDWSKQQFAEQAVSSSQKTLREAKANNTALVAIDPKTGQILAMVGSKDFFDAKINGQFNVATQGLRQPGSSFKPVIYAEAFRKGYTPYTLLFDVSTNFAVAGKEYRPVDYDGKEHGLVTIRQALQSSFNIPAVKTLYLVGLETALNTAKALGYTTLSEGNFGLTLVLGGGEVKLLEHTAAYATFANNGIHHAPVAILRVEDARGNVMKEWKSDAGETVFDPATMATLDHVLSDDAARAPVFGANSILTLPDRPVAAKTGTTNNYVDGWTMGYTPSLAAGVWVGNTDNSPLKPGYGGSKVAGTIWNAFMRQTLASTPVEQFPAPPVNDAQKPILRGALGGAITLPIDQVTGKIAVSSTPPENIVERSFTPAHSILHYVNKDDPRGPVPEHPEQDPQYSLWEQAIQDWIIKNRKENPNFDLRFMDPPTEYDDPNTFGRLPTLLVNAPAYGATLASRHLDMNIETSAPRGVARVTYTLDDRVIGIISRPPFNLSYYDPNLADGGHRLVVAAEDDIGDRRIMEVPFTLAAGAEPAGVAWVERALVLSSSDFPRVFFLNPFKLEQIREVRIYAQKSGDSSRTLVNTVNNFSKLFNNQITVSWNAPSVGSWVLTAEVTLQNGSIRDADTMMVVVH